MDVGDFLRITCEFTLPGASNPAINVWDFEVTQSTNPFDLTLEGVGIISELITVRYATISDYMSDLCVMTGASIRAFGDPTDGYDSAGILFEGTGLSGMMPPFVSLSLEMIRSNYAMRNGRKAIPGVVLTAAAVDGSFDETARGEIAGITAAWASNDIFIEGDASDFTLSARIVRAGTSMAVVPTVTSPVVGYGLAKFGTQNGRKA